MYDIITFGSATRDIIVKPKNLTVLKYNPAGSNSSTENIESTGVCFPLGSKIDVEQINFMSGGGGTNTSATFAKQGFKTAFFGGLGEDLASQEIIKELKNLKINTGLIQKSNEKPTNHSIVILDSNKERTILAYRGASEVLSKNGINFGKLKAKWFYLAPLSGQMCKAFEEIVDFASKNKIKIAANPGMAQLSLPHFYDIAKKIDILILNQEEASFLTKITFNREADIFRKIDEICPGIAVMTKGGEGVVVSDGKQIFKAKPNEKREVVDTTGAGDAFGAGFVSGFIHSKGDIEYAIQLGMANSEECISQIGAKNGLLKKGENFTRVEVLREECDNNICLVK
ncbi:MAG: carbohydrate kinase family protein [Candidatus Staskawiczbacteria bacterium]|nr:carbohydrate kinase family protein [Candidatus Staskawiczbacteria bacterium]